MKRQDGEPFAHASPEVEDLNRIGRLVPKEVERQRREYWDRIELAKRVFGKALNEIDQQTAKSGVKR